MPIERAFSVVDKLGVTVFDIGGDSVGGKDGSNRYLQSYETVTKDLLAASVDNAMWICQEGLWQVQYVSSWYLVAGGAGALFNVVVCPQGVAVVSGVAQLTTTISLVLTAPSMQHGTLIASPTVMARGDGVALDFSGTLTGLVGVCTLGLKRAD